MMKAEDFFSQSLNSKNFYARLPTDDVAKNLDIFEVDIIAQAFKFANTPNNSAECESILELLAIGLLSNNISCLPINFDWLELAKKASCIYAKELSPGGDRSLRMKSALVNYCILDLLSLSLEEDSKILETRTFTQQFVWDWMPFLNGEVLVDSTSSNTKYIDNHTTVEAFSSLLPTQLDAVQSSQLIAITSCYSDGMHLWLPGQTLKYISWHQPIVLFFEHESNKFIITRDGDVINYDKGVLVASFPVNAIWRARYLAGSIIASDWSLASVFFRLDMRTLGIDQIPSDPVILLNDICQVRDTYYLIDKMQGHVFSFDLNFNFMSKKMQFGKSPTRLYDPISIRNINDQLHVVSWLTGNMVVIPAF